jgi:hypothetical protein
VGEAKRRARKSPSLEALSAELREVEQEGQGVWDMVIHTLDAIPALLVDAKKGDHYASRTVHALADMASAIAVEARAGDPVLCLLCDTTFHPRREMPSAFVLVHAHHDDPTKCICNCICTRCCVRYPSAKALGPVVTDVYNRKLIPGLRVLPPISGGGRA